jgi:glycolate oxidase iron-sulfur subunit
MQTNLSPEFKNSADGLEAEAILRKCVHCGFCTATCPTYQLLGDELDGPRGRIYLIKQVLEGEAPTRKTQLHLDRCLTCRNCETTCPSGVQYGHLIDIGRKLVDERVERPATEKAMRWALKEGLPSPLFAPAMAVGQAVRGLLPASLKNKVPAKQPAGALPTATHARKMLLLEGCVQPAMMPNINAATARVLDAAGVQVVVAKKAGCCGAVKFHLNDQDGAKNEMRRNIDVWWPYVESGVEAIVMNASGCGSMVKDYGHHPNCKPKWQLILVRSHFTRPALCSTVSNSAVALKRIWGRWALTSKRRAVKRICAAARLVLIRYYNQKLPMSYATASWAI